MIEKQNYLPFIAIGTAFWKKHFDYDQFFLNAYEAGFRMFDTANMYVNEKRLGKAFINSHINRKEIIFISKIWPSHYKKCSSAVYDTLNRLQIDYIDIMFLHKSVKKYIPAFKKLIDLKEKGIIKYIGLSNFNVKQIEKVYKATHVYPDIIQIEVNPYYRDIECIEFCEKHNILVQGYSPIKYKKIFEEPIIIELTKKYHKSANQIILRYIHQLGVIPIAKSSKLHHMKDNFNIFNFSLTEEEMDKINLLHKKRDFRIFKRFSWWIDSYRYRNPNKEKI